MSDYVMCYRCLVCSQLYSDKGRVVLSYREDAENALFNAAIGSRTIPSETHYCDDGNIGLGLLAGYVIKISEDD